MLELWHLFAAAGAAQPLSTAVVGAHAPVASPSPGAVQRAERRAEGLAVTEDHLRLLARAAGIRARLSPWHWARRPSAPVMLLRMADQLRCRTAVERAWSVGWDDACLEAHKIWTATFTRIEAGL